MAAARSEGFSPEFPQQPNQPGPGSREALTATTGYTGSWENEHSSREAGDLTRSTNT